MGEEQKSYKSPEKKLLTFFIKSRDSWKQRAKDAVYAAKVSGNRIRFLESSKDALKQQVIEMQQVEEKLRKEIDALKLETQSIKKKTRVHL